MPASSRSRDFAGLSFRATKNMIRSLGLVSLRYPKIRYALSVSFMPRRAKRDTRYPKIRYALSVSLMPLRTKRDTLRDSYPIMPRRALTKQYGTLEGRLPAPSLSRRIPFPGVRTISSREQ